MSTTTMGPKGPRKTNTAIAGTAVVYGTAVKRGADQTTLVQATAASANIGVATDNQDTVGHAFQFAGPGEVVEGRVGAAVALDALPTSDANGKLVTAASTNPVVAIAREAATAADQLIAVEVSNYGRLAP
jgi:hypothetical protein